MEMEENQGSVSDVVDGVYRTLISASDEGELARRVCERFGLSSLCTYAWFGEYDEDAKTVTPKVAGGIDPADLESVSLDDEATRPSPHERAIETHTVQVYQQGAGVSAHEDRESASVKDTPRTHVVLPLASDETLHGILHLATDRPNAFDALDRDSFSELSGRIGYALADSESGGREVRRDAPDIEYEVIGRALETVPDLFYVLDAEGTLVHWNESVKEVTGYGEAELSSMHHSDFFTGDDVDRVEEAFRAIVGGESPVQIEATLVTKGGDTIPIESKATALENERGDVLGVCGTARDIFERKQRERQIAYQRDQLANGKDQIIETVPTGISIFDADGTLVQFNSRAADILKVDTDQLGKSFIECSGWTVLDADGDPVSPSDLPVARVLETGEALFNEEFKLEHPDQGAVWVIVNAAPLPEDAGGTTAIVAFEEITERKAREQYLRKVKNRLEAATEAGVVGTFEWRISDDEIVTSPTLARLFGVDPEAARDGVTLERFISSVHEGDRGRVRKRINDAIESREKYQEEYRVRDANGEVRWVMARGHVDYSSGDDSPQFHGAVTDVTERRRAEEALRESEKRLQTLIELLPVGVIVADADGRLLETNNAAEEIYGGFANAQSVTEFEQYTGWWPDSGERVAPGEWPLARALRGEEVSNPDIVEIEDPDDERRTVMVHAMPIRDEGGEMREAVITTVDVTERENRKQQLERQNSRLESFASMLAHELRNPLSIAQIYTQHARSGDDEAFEEVKTAHDRIEEMIDILLVLSRGVDSEIDSETVSLRKTATEVWSNLDVPSDRLVVETDVTLEVDPLHLRHILENLFENAAEHAEGTVTVEVGRLDGGFYVEDDGTGFSEPDCERVFEAGFTTKEDGIGLGLTFIAQLADAYEWEYRAVDGEGGGARFEFTAVETCSPE